MCLVPTQGILLIDSLGSPLDYDATQLLRERQDQL
jgi:hypothetical protein